MIELAYNIRHECHQKVIHEVMATGAYNSYKRSFMFVTFQHNTHRIRFLLYKPFVYIVKYEHSKGEWYVCGGMDEFIRY